MRRLWSWTVRALRLLLRAAAAFVVVTAAQVLLVRWFDPPFTLTMVDRALGEVRDGRGLRWPDARPVALDAVGDAVPRAIVASEDARFFLHHGFDFGAICAALKHNAEGGRLRGGSTLSQQVAKNVFLWQGRSWARKGLEAWYTVLLEGLVPKRRILELYLNVAETGPMVFGVEAGARHHFGKAASALGADEAGRLAGLLPDPRHRSVSGPAARDRAQWIALNPAPFPGDRRFELVREAVREEPGLWSCFE